MQMTHREVYLSFDIEADGPVPGRYSMLSIGFCVAGTSDGTGYVAADPQGETLYLELQPITPHYQPSALQVNGLDRDKLLASGLSPSDAVGRIAAWIDRVSVSAGPRPVAVAYPATFDWPFLAYYFHSFSPAGDLPIPFTRVCDLRTLIVARSHKMYYTPTSECLPAGLVPERPHTHNALQDAIDQAELFSAVMSWPGNRQCC